ncbi:MAG: RloB domain-containing protein [Clostridia bacterium]|nr:RloB domain-containing protein [Clostridia bacterium]
MSAIHVKKSDMDKSWLPKRRDRNIKSQLEYHLIICEGSETEPKYFETLKKKIIGDNRKKIDIEVIGKGKGTTVLLDEAIKKVQNSTNYISNVWLVYDKDDFTNESFNEVSKSCIESNKSNGTIYNAIWSNESFEVWVLLHFIRFDTPISRKECIKKINENFKKKGMGKYQKNDEKLYDKLLPYLNNAIKNAKWLEEKYIDILPSEMCPCTKVRELVELLEKYT